MGKKWVSLTDEEIEKIQTEWLLLEIQTKGLLPKYYVARAIEQALGNKNENNKC